MQPSVGEIVELEIEKLVAGGEGLGRMDGGVVFARPAYPGDRVAIRVTEVKKRFARGTVETLITPSPERRSDPCPIAETCGGCDWTSYRLDAQLRAKRQIVSESIRRIGRLDASAIPEIRLHGSPLNYRLRSRLHCDDSGALGFYEIRSHKVVPIVPECEVVGPLLRNAIAGGELRGTPGNDVVFLENGSRLVRSDSASATPPEELEITVRGHRFVVSPDSFFQVNLHLLGTLHELVVGHAEGVTSRNRALDLYGGVGFFAVPMAGTFRHVVTVESHPGGHELALANVPSPGVEAIHSDVLAYLRQERVRPGMVFVDPPRSGVHPGVIEEIDRLDPEVISYLSCDPGHLARDLLRFHERGWLPRSIDVIDLFPNTHHIETLVSLRRS